MSFISLNFYFYLFLHIFINIIKILLKLLKSLLILLGAPTQRWHADGSHQEEIEHPYGLCVFLPLIDIDEAVGKLIFV
jgi:hypothetical protein